MDEEQEHPEHKIYRKTAIRFSIVQKFRALLSEESKNKQSTSYKQNSKNIGARIANPDYEDPHRLFTSTPTSSQSSLVIYHDDGKRNDYDNLIDDEHLTLDMSLNENDVLTEFDKRLKESKEIETNCFDTGQSMSQSNVSKSSHYQKSISLSHISGDIDNAKCERSNSDIFSSQNSDSYYENILEKKLNGVNIARNGSFKTSTNDDEINESNNQMQININNNNNANVKVSQARLLKRPNKAPPPIPTKPKFLTNVCTTTVTVKKEYNSILKTNSTLETNKMETYEQNLTMDNNKSVALNMDKNVQQPHHFLDGFNPNSKGWVKTIINRFE